MPRAIAAVGTVQTLIRFALVPQHAADAIGQPRLPHAPEHPAVDCREVNGFCLIALMLVDAGATDRGIDDEDRHRVALHQALGELHAPPAEFRHLTFLRFPNRFAPQNPPGSVLLALRPAVTADPLAGFRRGFFAGVRRQRIGLPFDQPGVAANQVDYRLHHGLGGAGLGAEPDLVIDQSGLELGG